MTLNSWYRNEAVVRIVPSLTSCDVIPLCFSQVFDFFFLFFFSFPDLVIIRHTRSRFDIQLDRMKPLEFKYDILFFFLSIFPTLVVLPLNTPSLFVTPSDIYQL